MTTQNKVLAIVSFSLVTAFGMTGAAHQYAFAATANAPKLMASSEQQVEVAERGSGRIDGDSTSLSIQGYRAS
jgi:hypothetical protein